MTNSCKLDHSIFDERQNNYYESSNKLQTPNNDKKSAKLRSCGTDKTDLSLGANFNI